MFTASTVRAFRASRRAAMIFLAGVALSLCGSAAMAAQPTAKTASKPPSKRLQVVATFSILGDMVREIGGEHIVLNTIVGAGADAHSFEPTPRDIQALAKAQVLVLNGLDFEGWLPRLVQSSGFKGAQVMASKGVTVRQLAEAPGHHHEDGHHHGDVDPHAWQSLSNGMIYAQNIADGLAQAAPAHSAYFKNRAKLYIEQMKKLDTEIKQAFADIPPEKRRVITSHDAFGYFERAYGIHFISVAGLSNDAEPSAKDVAAIIDRAKNEHVAGVFVEQGLNPRIVEQIARETGAKVGEGLYADTLAKPDQPASTYLGMFSWNAGQLIYVLKGNGA